MCHDAFNHTTYIAVTYAVLTWCGSTNGWSMMMSSLVVLGFDGLHTADEVLNKRRSLQTEIESGADQGRLTGKHLDRTA
jgi:hypothetical protein